VEDTSGNSAGLCVKSLTGESDLDFPYSAFEQNPGSKTKVDFTNISSISQIIDGDPALDAELGVVSSGYKPVGFAAGLVRVQEQPLPVWVILATRGRVKLTRKA
jgi:hypothetical protein